MTTSAGWPGFSIAPDICLVNAGCVPACPSTHPGIPTPNPYPIGFRLATSPAGIGEFKAVSKILVARRPHATRHTLQAAALSIGVALPPRAQDDAPGCRSSWRIVLWQTVAPAPGPD